MLHKSLSHISTRFLAHFNYSACEKKLLSRPPNRICTTKDFWLIFFLVESTKGKINWITKIFLLKFTVLLPAFKSIMRAFEILSKISFSSLGGRHWILFLLFVSIRWVESVLWSPRLLRKRKESKRRKKYSNSLFWHL